MREILFRGKRVNNGEWVYGLLTIMWGQYHIIDLDDENTAYPVDPATIGQYTGLTDKNGVKIFEGDILRIDEPEFIPTFGIVQFGEYDLNLGFFIEWLNDMMSYRPHLGCWAKRPYCAVCGNIHDDPELLK